MARRRRRRRRIRWGRVFAALLVLVLLIGGITKAITAARQHKSNNKDQSAETPKGETTYIAVLGVDYREELGSSRSDVMVLAYVNFETSEIDLVSLPRDSYVSIPCMDGAYDKITHAYFYGGLNGDTNAARSCALGAIEGTFEIDKITRYVIFDFNSIKMLVDELGGITLTPSKTFCEMGTDYQGYCFEGGEPMTLNGEQALAYARHRASDNDIYRTQRTQQVITALYKKVRSLNYAQMLAFATKMLGEIETNISLTDALTYYELISRENFILSRTTVKGGDWYDESGTYYFKIDDAWLDEYIKKIHPVPAAQ